MSDCCGIFRPRSSYRNGVCEGVCACTVSVCVCMRVHKCLLSCCQWMLTSRTQEDLVCRVRLFLGTRTRTVHTDHTHTQTHIRCCASSSGETEKYMQHMYIKPRSWLYNAQSRPPTPYFNLTGPHSRKQWDRKTLNSC